MTEESIINLATALWLGFIGACIGSFLNVVAYRMPRGVTVIWKPSHCPHCNHPVRARDNVPVFAWLWLRGKCRDCGGPISARYAIVEAAMGLAFLVLAYVELFSGGANIPGGPLVEAFGAAHIVWEPQWQVIGLYAYHCALLSVLMAIVLIDQDHQVVPLRVALFGALVIAVCATLWPQLYPQWTFFDWSAPSTGFADAAYGALASAGLFLAALALVTLLPGKYADKQASRNMTAALALAGGVLGLSLWLPLYMLLFLIALALHGTVNRFIKRKSEKVAPMLWSLWISIFIILVFWRPITDYLSTCTWLT